MTPRIKARLKHYRMLGRIKARIPVDLPRPREAGTLRDPRFVDLAAAVRDQIEAQWLE